MQITAADKKTLELISELACYKTLAHNAAFQPIKAAFERVLINDPHFFPEEDLSTYIQREIRLKLLNQLKAEEQKKNNTQMIEATFQLLLLLANFWALNAKAEGFGADGFICPINRVNIPENDKAITISGYLFTKTALTQAWSVDPRCLNPMTNEVSSKREKNYILGGGERPGTVEEHTEHMNASIFWVQASGLVFGASLTLGLELIIVPALIAAMTPGVGSLLASIAVVFAVGVVAIAAAFVASIIISEIVFGCRHAKARHEYDTQLKSSNTVAEAIADINAERDKLAPAAQQAVINVEPQGEPEPQIIPQAVIVPKGEVEPVMEAQAAPVIPEVQAQIPPIRAARVSAREGRLPWLNRMFPPVQDVNEFQPGAEHIDQIEGFEYRRLNNAA